MKFDSKVGGLTMFGDVAVELLRMMGHSGTVPSAILAADLPQAVARLDAALKSLPGGAQAPRDAAAKDEADKVPLRRRAFPLLELAKRAADAGVDLMWDRV